MPSFTNGLAQLEQIIRQDPRQIDDYAANPFGILVYDPKEECLLRTAIDHLVSRLAGTRRLKLVSLADLFQRALEAQIDKERSTFEEWFELERMDGFEHFSETLANILAEQAKLETLVAEEANELDAQQDVLILLRAGIFYPFFHVSPMLEGLARHTRVPVVLCYPGGREGVTGLRFLDQHQALRGYRQKVY